MINRDFEHEIMPEILARWSTRSFDPDWPVAQDDLAALFEAARYAPSCFNEQPWRFLVADREPARSRLIACLNDSNQVWAAKAPVLLLILARRTFARNGRDNRWHLFDTGTAWGFLQLEAQRRGLVTHAMGGFDVTRARQAFAIADDIDIVAAVAVGHAGNAERLPPDLAAREHPSPRRSIREILFFPDENPTTI